MDTKTILLSLSLAAATATAQQRPVVQTKFTADLTRKVSGKADLYLVFRGEGTGLFELDWWELSK